MTKSAGSQQENSAFADLRLAAAVAILPTVLLVARVYRGLTLSPDSLHYLYAARTFAQSGVFLSPDDSPLTLYAPLYSACLALLMKFGLSVDLAAEIISASCLFLSSAISYRLFLRISDNRYVAAIATLVIFLNPEVQTIFSFAWSEHLYLLLSLAILNSLMAAMASDRALTFRKSAALGALAGLAVLDKYSGIALIVATLIVLLMDPRVSIPRRLLDALCVASVSALLVSPWLVRNRLADGTLFGQRGLTDDTLVFALKRIALTAGNFIFASDLWRDSRFSLSLGAILLTTVLLLALSIVMHSRRMYILMFPALALSMTQVALLIASSVTTPLDPLSARLLVSVFVPFAIVAMGCFRYVLQQQTLNFRQLRTFVGPLLLAIAIVCIDVRADAVATLSMRPGYIGAPLRVLTEADIPEICRSGNFILYANKNAYLRYIGIKEPVFPLPRRPLFRRAIRTANWDSFKESVRAHTVCLLWVRNFNSDEPSFEELLGGEPDGLSIRKISESDELYVYLAHI